MITSVMSDMLGLLIVLVLITVGFSLVFAEFSTDHDYSNSLLDTYLLLFARYQEEDFSLSEKLILCFLLFVFSIIVINLLISITTDSYNRTQEKKVLTDSLTRLHMIQDALTLKRTFKVQTNANTKNGYLIYCGNSHGDEEDGSMQSAWEGSVNIIKRLHKQNDVRRTKEANDVRQQMSKVSQKMTEVNLNITQELKKEVSHIQKEIQNMKKQFGGTGQKMQEMQETFMKNKAEMKRYVNLVKQEVVQLKEENTRQHEEVLRAIAAKR